MIIRTKLANYIVIILLCCVFTAGLNILHTLYILEMDLSVEAFITPVIAGVIFGYLLTHNKLLSDELARMAHTDSLMQIYNRMHFNEYLETEIGKVKRYGGFFSIIFFDIDHFKDINDRYGHQVGDEVLKLLAAVVNNANRDSDVFARYGGEEFVILATSTDLKGATQHAERLRKDIARYPFIPNSSMTASFGVTEFRPETDDLAALVKRADEALYRAKRNGRNQVVSAE